MHPDDEDVERDDADVRVLLQRLDHPAPAMSAQEIIDRAERGGGGARHARGGGGGARYARGGPGWRDRGFDEATRMRWAAGFLVALGIVAAAAYAIPGSPARVWVAAVRAWVGHRASSAPGTVRDDTGFAGVSVPPGDAFVIEFTSPQSMGEVTITLTDDAEIVARAASGAATFSSGPDRLVIDNRGSSSAYEVRIPRSAPRVEVRLRETSLYLKEGDHVTTSVKSDAAGNFHIPLTSVAP